ncbi:pyruvate kinase [Variovorax sp. J22R115]|uniref:pyruvate kinase n=1 Tax=Variovorax sp. J22R115 TaxID=3053509 RepID=UPI002575C103|nr:pyruvate kinase [Variovorax sp. J22R115]MDM0053974.1 pyruvate kinase [Variovorax sp. J22R115]
MHRQRHAKIVATLGPASSDAETIRTLFDTGADVFRFNFSHGSHEQHRARYDIVRRIEQETGRPIAILLDLQGPKLRVGSFENGPVTLVAGNAFRLDLDATPGTAGRAPLPHPEIFAALKAGTDLLLDDGKIRLRVQACGADFADTTVIAGGNLSERKGVNVPEVLLPISALTAKDRADLDFGLQLGVDWVALSFVQRPEDMQELRDIVKGRAGVLAKLEKPAAIERLDAIVALSDAIMVARGDLGVEMPAEQVPRIQKRIVRTCRDAGKPVIVATQMLESMISTPVPTRAEASDVATAIYDGTDAVMLSAESASGQYPREAVAMMDRIIAEVERDPHYRTVIDTSHSAPQPTVADAICASLRQTASLVPVAAMVTYTRSGYTSLRAARERPVVPVVSITPELPVARRLALAWGVHSVHVEHDVNDVTGMVETGCAVARNEGYARPGDIVVIAAGMPFGKAGTTNLLHIARA